MEPQFVKRNQYFEFLGLPGHEFLNFPAIAAGDDGKFEARFAAIHIERRAICC